MEALFPLIQKHNNRLAKVALLQFLLIMDMMSFDVLKTHVMEISELNLLSFANYGYGELCARADPPLTERCQATPLRQ